MIEFEIKNAANTQLKLSGGKATAFLIFQKFTSYVTQEAKPKIHIDTAENSDSIKLSFTFKKDPGKPIVDSLRKALDADLKDRRKFDYTLVATPVSNGFFVELQAYPMGGSKPSQKMSLNNLRNLKAFEA